MTEKEIDDFMDKYQETYNEGFKKIVEAEKLYSEFLKVATQDDLKMITKKAMERLEKIKDVLLKRQQANLPNNVLPFIKNPNKDNLN